MREPVSWREALAEMDGSEQTVVSMLSVVEGDPAAEMEAAAERLLIRAARAGNPMTAEQVARVRLAARRRAGAAEPEPFWRGEVEAAGWILTRSAA